MEYGVAFFVSESMNWHAYENWNLAVSMRINRSDMTGQLEGSAKMCPNRRTVSPTSIGDHLSLCTTFVDIIRTLTECL